jgi:hypothetical protein
MNEVYAAEPTAFNSSAELKLMLDYFGPFAGRYLAAYPNDWFKRLEVHLAGWGDVAKARAMTRIRRAKDGSSFVSNAAFTWDDAKPWLENAVSLVESRPRKLSALVVSDESSPAGRDGVVSISDLELTPTAEERIESSPAEYCRATKTLLLISPELTFVDAYLNPGKKLVLSVLEQMLDVIAKGKCRKLTCWARTSEVIGEHCASAEELRKVLGHLVQECPLQQGFVVKFMLVNDSRSRDRMHDRYILSIKGGIELGQGFQQLQRNRRVKVGPVGKSTFDECYRMYVEGETDMARDQTVLVTKH